VPLTGSAAILAVESCLQKSVALRLEADVPVGAYLSGGLDSSLTTALMKKARDGGEVETFSAGFSDPRFDELPYARQVSEALGTRHHEIVVSATDFVDHWAELTWHRDGPISEPADIAVFKVAKRAQQDVKVLLSGEGADELFAGYPKHAFDPKLSPLWRIPGPIRRRMFRFFERALPGSQTRARIAARALTARTAAERIQTWFAPFTWYERRSLRKGFGTLIDSGQFQHCQGDLLRRMLYVDCHTWLTDNLLERGDRMSMAASIENRPPFLDHHLVELAFNLSSALKLHRGQTKWIVREIGRKYLPAAIIDRRKVGFRVPLDEWFRVHLKDMAHDLLLGNDSFVSGYLERSIVRRLLQDHESRRRDESIRIWTLLGLEVWHRRFMRGATAFPAPRAASTS
jgi:asparagine synthase (glutamine-hydrolysing)